MCVIRLSFFLINKLTLTNKQRSNRTIRTNLNDKQSLLGFHAIICKTVRMADLTSLENLLLDNITDELLEPRVSCYQIVLIQYNY